jgi:peptidyl-prolyl cis-trans isomerase A (cyclophilin A)
MHKQHRIWTTVILVFITLFSAKSTTQAGLVVEFDTSIGAFYVELFDSQKPISVANFLLYADSGLYDNTIIHRSVDDFVIQGGGYYPTGNAVPTFGPISDEIGLSNLRGTLAYANIGSPNTNVNQWFFNVDDNLFLDSGFTVFGRVLGNGMDIVDQINGLPLVNIGLPFNELPVMDPGLPLFASNLVIINSITTIPEPGSMMLLLAGIACIGFKYRCRRSL